MLIDLYFRTYMYIGSMERAQLGQSKLPEAWNDWQACISTGSIGIFGFESRVATRPDIYTVYTVIHKQSCTCNPETGAWATIQERVCLWQMERLEQEMLESRGRSTIFGF
jgi:hypothetical protein